MDNSLSILIAGDFVPYDRTKQIVDDGTFEKLFSKELKREIEGADYSVVNLEAPVVKPFFKPIKKVGPTLSAGDNTPKALKYAGFQIAAMANNHMNDYGAEGILNTISRCHEEGLDTIGAGKDKEATVQYVVKETKGSKVAFINCCEHEFSVTDQNEPGCNPLDPIAQSYAIKAAKRIADFVVVIVHGGIEHYQLPTPRMQKTYRFFVDEGADAVVNHHQHCYSGYEFYNGHPIIYGLGNFCFDWQVRDSKKWREGYMAKLTLSTSTELELIPYIQNGSQEGVRLMSVEEKKDFEMNIAVLNKVVSSEADLEKAYEQFLCHTDKEMRAVLSLYPGRILTALCRKGLLPVWANGYRYRRMWLNVSCESHIERIRHYLKRKFK